MVYITTILINSKFSVILSSANTFYKYCNINAVVSQ